MNVTVSQLHTNNAAGLILKRSYLAFIVILFFCNIAVYLSLAVSAHLEPQYWIALLVVVGGALAWISPRTRWDVFRTPVFFWCVLFLALTLIFFVAVPASHIEQLKERIRDVVLLTAFLGVFLMLRTDLNFIRKLVLIAVILGVVINLISLFHNNYSGFLRPPSVAYAYRPGGFYINPNESATALIFGMILSISILPLRWRIAYAAFVFVGVLATFSREAVAAWVVVAFCLCLFRIIEWKRLLLWTAVLVAVAAVAMFAVIKTHLINVHTVDYYYQQVLRFVWFIPGIPHGTSVSTRLKVLHAGWVLFLAHPWVGAGIGSTYHWDLAVSTHNMYLLYMDDYGIMGIFLYPLLIWCMLRKAAGETRKLAWTMAVFLLFWGLFDHNIVQNYYSLFAIALTAAMSRISAAVSAQRAAPIPAQAASD